MKIFLQDISNFLISYMRYVSVLLLYKIGQHLQIWKNIVPFPRQVFQAKFNIWN